MVEGPGCMVKGERIKARLLGQTVKKVTGNAVKREKKSSGGDNPIKRFGDLVGRPLDDVLTLGKELFLFFGDICIRVHFLMAGTFRVNGEQIDHDLGKIANTASLEVTFDLDTLTFYKTSVEVRSSEDSRLRYKEMHGLDICTPDFDLPRAIAMVMGQTGRLVCDVLLDQTVLPGVGNIIKNEALFTSGIHPAVKIDVLEGNHVCQLIENTRKFSMIFYECRQDGSNLIPHQQIYRVSRCKVCEGKVTRENLGEAERVCYYCATCQPLKTAPTGRKHVAPRKPVKAREAKKVEAVSDVDQSNFTAPSRSRRQTPGRPLSATSRGGSRRSRPLSGDAGSKGGRGQKRQHPASKKEPGSRKKKAVHA